MIARFWRDYNLSIVLGAMFIVSWLIQTLAGWFQYAAEQTAHGAAGHVFGADGYFWPWAEATFENWQSEFLQLFTFVVLTTFLIHRKSHESRDSDEEVQASLRRIEKQVKELAGASSGGRR
ncbi:MAG TPA: DUF6766 family protein [Candidatus Limnocylindrales bacterium]